MSLQYFCYLTNPMLMQCDLSHIYDHLILHFSALLLLIIFLSILLKIKSKSFYSLKILATPVSLFLLLSYPPHLFYLFLMSSLAYLFQQLYQNSLYPWQEFQSHFFLFYLLMMLFFKTQHLNHIVFSKDLIATYDKRKAKLPKELILHKIGYK